MAAVLGTLIVNLLMFLRFFFPRALFEPRTTFRIDSQPRTSSRPRTTRPSAISRHGACRRATTHRSGYQAKYPAPAAIRKNRTLAR